MNKNEFENVSLTKGEMHVYDFGTIRLHAYKTNDFIDDEVFFFEKDGKAVMLESPCFFDNYQELTDYFAGRGVSVDAALIAYHMAGGSFLSGVRKCAAANAIEYGVKGGGKALCDNFSAAFGDAFDKKPHDITDIIQAGRLTLCGIDFIITVTQDAFDVEIPEINAVYTHMLGHDCHSIVAGAAHADAMIAVLSDYLKKGYSLVLTSHYTPEDLKDVETKIAYLKDLSSIAAASADKAAFKAAVQKRYPQYSGENYLDMTAGFFFAS